VAQIPPFRLFLIVVVLVFFVVGLSPSKRTVVNVGSEPASAQKNNFDIHLGQAANDPAGKWFTARMTAAARNPERFEATIVEWAQRLAVLALPLSAAMLGLMFFWRRGVFMFDHLIFSMHSLSFQGLLIAVVMLAERLSNWFGWLLVAAPIHLFAHLKGVYGLGVFGTLARMLALFLGSAIGFVAALVGLVLIGLVEIGQ
jgi:hypothetical protein